MKESKRQKQVGEVIRRHFGSVLMAEGSYIYGQAMVTVTNVIMSSDLGLAKIYLSIYNEENKDGVMSLMDAHLVPLRKALAQRIKKHVRRIPHIAFYIDDTVDEMYRVDALFDSIGMPKTQDEEE